LMKRDLKTNPNKNESNLDESDFKIDNILKDE
jgi:hypothetical protein